MEQRRGEVAALRIDDAGAFGDGAAGFDRHDAAVAQHHCRILDDGRGHRVRAGVDDGDGVAGPGAGRQQAGEHEHARDGADHGSGSSARRPSSKSDSGRRPSSTSVTPSTMTVRTWLRTLNGSPLQSTRSAA